MTKRIEELTKEELWDLRQEVVLNSLFIADYRNSFGISARSACDLFDGYCSFLWELAELYGDDWDRQDSPEHLQEYVLLSDDYSWVEYEKQEQEDLQPVLFIDEDTAKDFDVNAWLDYAKIPGKLTYRPKDR